MYLLGTPNTPFGGTEPPLEQGDLSKLKYSYFRSLFSSDLEETIVRILPWGVPHLLDHPETTKNHPKNIQSQNQTYKIVIFVLP